MDPAHCRGQGDTVQHEHQDTQELDLSDRIGDVRFDQRPGHKQHGQPTPYEGQSGGFEATGVVDIPFSYKPQKAHPVDNEDGAERQH
jgi:hypothetical protein